MTNGLHQGNLNRDAFISSRIHRRPVSIMSKGGRYQLLNKGLPYYAHDRTNTRDNSAHRRRLKLRVAALLLIMLGIYVSWRMILWLSWLSFPPLKEGGLGWRDIRYVFILYLLPFCRRLMIVATHIPRPSMILTGHDRQR
jgi:hypothetical protein